MVRSNPQRLGADELSRLDQLVFSAGGNPPEGLLP